MTFPTTLDTITDGVTTVMAAHVKSLQDILVGPIHINICAAKYRAIGTWDPIAGTGDFSAALAQALTDLSAGGVLYFPPGVYMHSAQTDLPSNVILEGAGGSVSIIRAVPGFVANSMIVLHTGCKMVHMGIQGRNVAFSGTAGNGISVTDAAHDIMVDDCDVSLCDADGVVLTYTASASRIEIRGCRIHDNWNEGIFIPQGVTASVIEGNYIYNNGSNGLDHNGNGNIIRGNWVSNNGIGTDVGIPANDHCGIYCFPTGATDNVDQNTIEDNMVINNNKDGIFVAANIAGTNARYTHIEGNQCYSNGRDGIRVDGALGGVIANTLVSNNISCLNTGWGVNNTGATVADSLVVNNVVLNNTAGNINDSGTATVLAGNKFSAGDTAYWVTGAPVLKVDATGGSANSTLFLTARNAGVAKTTSMVADQNGQLTVTPTAGQPFTIAGAAGLIAGTTTIAPLKFTSGTNLTTAAAGVREYDGVTFYSTPVASNRGVDQLKHFISQTANWNGGNVATAQPVFNASAAGTITLPALTSYFFEGCYHITNAGTTSHTLGLLFGGAATITSCGYQFYVTNGTVATATAPLTGWIAVATNSPITAATAAATDNTILIRGIVRINGAGTFIPQFIYSVAPGAAPVISANSYFSMTPIGSNTVATVGNWS